MAIRKVTSGELLTKQATKEEIYYKEKSIHTSTTQHSRHCNWVPCIG
jgi:hypothetical protein